MFREPRTDRGQTIQDYAIGMGLFLLVVVFVLSFLPAVLTPFENVDEAQREAQAERVADTIVDRAALSDERVHLNATVLTEQIGATNESAAFGLAPRRSINLTMRVLGNSSTVAVGGETYDGQSAGTWTRIVTTENGACSSGCRILVRVW